MMKTIVHLIRKQPLLCNQLYRISEFLKDKRILEEKNFKK